MSTAGSHVQVATHIDTSPSGSDPSGSVSARAPYPSVLIWIACRMPTAARVQPIALRGRASITAAPENVNDKMASPAAQPWPVVRWVTPGRIAPPPDHENGTVASSRTAAVATHQPALRRAPALSIPAPPPPLWPHPP